MNRTFSIFLRLLWRDTYIYFKQKRNYLINYCLIYPATLSLTYGFVFPKTNFASGALPSTGVLLAGSITFIFIILPVALNLFLLFDFEGDRFIDYQMLLISPRLVILEKIIFSATFNFILLLPFFPIAKLLLRDNFDISNISVIKLLVILYLSSLTCCAYVVLSMCIMKSTYQLGNWWRRVNGPMFIFGGSWTPWIAIFNFSQILGYFVLINPIIYVTEGVRGAILGEGIYIPFLYCVIALIISTTLFISATFYFFKKRTDHI